MVTQWHDLETVANLVGKFHVFVKCNRGCLAFVILCMHVKQCKIMCMGGEGLREPPSLLWSSAPSPGLGSPWLSSLGNMKRGGLVSADGSTRSPGCVSGLGEARAVSLLRWNGCMVECIGYTC